jgi:hypothetical protein
MPIDIVLPGDPLPLPLAPDQHDELVGVRNRRISCGLLMFVDEPAA